MKIIPSLLIVILLVSCNAPKENSINAKTNETISQAESDLRDIWVLSEMLGLQLDTINYPDGKPNLELNPRDSTVIGFTGCNNLNASLEVKNEGTLKFGPLATTRKYCINVPEALFLDFLTQTVRYNRDGLYLELFNDSTKVLTFKKVD